MRAKAALQRHPLQPGGPLAVAVLEDDQLLAHTHLRELGGADLRSLMSVLVPRALHSWLLVAASRDDVVPPAAMTRLWEATAKPKIVWIDATHVGAAVHLFPMMRAVVDHMTK